MKSQNVLIKQTCPQVKKIKKNFLKMLQEKKTQKILSNQKCFWCLISLASCIYLSWELESVQFQ